MFHDLKIELLAEFTQCLKSFSSLFLLLKQNHFKDFYEWIQFKPKHLQATLFQLAKLSWLDQKLLWTQPFLLISRHPLSFGSLSYIIINIVQ
jgi:hypothetical protein